MWLAGWAYLESERNESISLLPADEKNGKIKCMLLFFSADQMQQIAIENGIVDIRIVSG